MRKIIVFIFIAGVYSSATAGDTVSVKHRVDPPVRTVDSDGDPIPDNLIPIYHEKDCDPNGWRYDIWEWMDIKRGRLSEPEFYVHPEYGSNHGSATV